MNEDARVADGGRTGRWLGVDGTSWTPEALAPAVAWLREGGVVAFPTDTFYGLAVDPTSREAVRLLFDVKGRDASVAVPLIAASTEQVEASLGFARDASRHLADAFWPGPLSLILDAPASIASGVHGGRGTVAVRVPAHAAARALAAAFGWPITATSANLSGTPPVDRAARLDAVADHPRVFIVDAGITPGGAPSTIVDARGATPICVRAGAVAWDRVLTSI